MIAPLVTLSRPEGSPLTLAIVGDGVERPIVLACRCGDNVVLIDSIAAPAVYEAGQHLLADHAHRASFVVQDGSVFVVEAHTSLPRLVLQSSGGAVDLTAFETRILLATLPAYVDAVQAARVTTSRRS